MMNIYLRELKKRWKGVLVWSAVITLFMVLSMAKYGSFTTDPQAVSTLLDQFPSTLKAVFGMSGLNLATVTGYYGVNFIFLALMLSIHAGLLGTDVLASEEQAKTAEFLYPKPVSRTRVITEKILAAFTVVVVIAVVTAVVTFVSMRAYAPFSDFGKAFWLFTAALAAIQLVSLFVGTAIAAVTKRPKLAPAHVAQFVVVSYFIFVFIKLITSLDWLKYLSIFSLFDATDILDAGSLEPLHIGICLAAIVVSVAMTFILYRRRDLSA